ncbi:hypothetical protein DFQ27_003990 [Actinomortierella ambigua]|uniref:Spindle pole body component n=1 Tax=Actinomortierella ambigua TaxID=1343610 RepID=A0A9P6QI84_9FUNG|nr:hypothetical protein DFQ27_003990 [Actinomortierella ambigua]
MTDKTPDIRAFGMQEFSFPAKGKGVSSSSSSEHPQTPFDPARHAAYRSNTFAGGSGYSIGGSGGRHARGAPSDSVAIGSAGARAEVGGGGAGGSRMVATGSDRGGGGGSGGVHIAPAATTRSRADSMPSSSSTSAGPHRPMSAGPGAGAGAGASNAHRTMSGVLADDVLRKISTKISEGSTIGRANSMHRDENVYRRAPLIPRIIEDQEMSSRPEETIHLGSINLHQQEQMLIDDILFTLLGIEGKYTTMVPIPTAQQDPDAEYIHREFRTDESFDPSLRDLAARVLPLASIYLSIEAFIELHSRFEYGFVSHALCAAMRSLLKEYVILVAQLENQFRTTEDFTLQKLWFYIQPTMQTLTSLDVLVGVIREAGRREIPEDEIEAFLNPPEGVPQEVKGGNILAMIAAGMFNMSGDPVTKKLYSYLLSKASIPYISMLESWIHRGEIRDPYDEFMIVESRKVRKENIKEDFSDAYWEQRYTIRANCVPSFLKPLENKILLAGKYLNVIRECGIHISNGGTPTQQQQQQHQQAHASASSQAKMLSEGLARGEVLSVMNGGLLVETIEAAYQEANTRLLDLLLKERQLLARLRSMKRYFFLDQSDYFTHFLDLAFAELKRPSREVSLTKLQSLMDLVLRNPASVTVNDAFKEDLKVEMSRTSLLDQLLRVIHVNNNDNNNNNSNGGNKVAPGGDMTRSSTFPTRADSRMQGARTHSRANSVAPLSSYQQGHGGSGGGGGGSNDSWNEDGPDMPMHGGGYGYGYGGRDSAMEGVIGSTHHGAGDPSPSSAASKPFSITSSSVTSSSSSSSLSGMDALTLDYTVTFPLSLVISRKALTKYQLLFRHLLGLKHAEQLLCQTWAEHTKNKIWRHLSKEMRGWRGRVYALRGRMMSFVQQFAYYVFSEVLEPNWRTLVQKLDQVSTVDQVLKFHSDFLDTCLKECMLTNSKLLRIYSKLISTCIKFANYTERFTRALSAMEIQLDDEAASKAPPSQIQLIEQAMRRLNEFEDGFLYHIKLLMEALHFYSATETVQFLCLVVRLDFNQFYAHQKEQQ